MVPGSRQARLILFAKTPTAGLVKTRMVPVLGEAGAAALAEAMIEGSVRNALNHWPGEVVLQVWPDRTHPCFATLGANYGIKVVLQSRGSLGDKMLQALNDGLEAGVRPAIMGCDVPHCPAEVFRRAHREILAGKPTIGPSSDGGYYLISILPPPRALFDNISWGTDQVLGATLRKAEQAGVEFQRLPELNDLDTWDDIEILRRFDPHLVEALLSHVAKT